MAETLDSSIGQLIDAIVAGRTALAESFFLGHGLSEAFAGPSPGWGLRKRINSALLEAERQGIRDEVLADAADRYGVEMPRSVRSLKRPQAATGRLFISHASSDESLADVIADLLRLGTGLSHEKILCTSLEGMGIPNGTDDYVGFLRAEIEQAKLVLPLITPQFLESPMCLLELGAAWGLGKEWFPLIAPPVTYQDVESVMGKVQAAQVNKSSDLARLHDRVVETFGVAPVTEMWEAKRKQLRPRITAELRRLAPPSRFSAAAHEAVVLAKSEAEAQVAELEEEAAELARRVEELARLKDQEAVAEVLVDPTKKRAFEEAAAVAAAAVNELPEVVRTAAYFGVGRGEDYYPEEFDIVEADAAVRDDQMYWDDETGGYGLNREDPDVEQAVLELEGFFGTEWSEEVLDQFKAEHRKVFRRSSEPVWRALKLL